MNSNLKKIYLFLRKGLILNIFFIYKDLRNRSIVLNQPYSYVNYCNRWQGGYR